MLIKKEACLKFFCCDCVENKVMKVLVKGLDCRIFEERCHFSAPRAQFGALAPLRGATNRNLATRRQKLRNS